FIGDGKTSALEDRGKRAFGVVHLECLSVAGGPGVAAVFGAAEHLAEGRPLVVHGVLHEGGDGGVDADETVARGDEIEQRLAQFGVVEKYALRVVEADGVEL